MPPRHGHQLATQNLKQTGPGDRPDLVEALGAVEAKPRALTARDQNRPDAAGRQGRGAAGRRDRGWNRIAPVPQPEAGRRAGLLEAGQRGPGRIPRLPRGDHPLSHGTDQGPVERLQLSHKR